MHPRPHDLLWSRLPGCGWQSAGAQPAWVAALLELGLPWVVRRGPAPSGMVAVGVRGAARQQRHPGWLDLAQVAAIATPEMLARARGWRHHPRLDALPALTELERLAPWLDAISAQHGIQWGITGGVGYELACKQAVLHLDSDLDLLLRCAQPLPRGLAAEWQDCLRAATCRIDVQLQVPAGAVALAEWARAGRVLLKTQDGPCLVDDPWRWDPYRQAGAARREPIR